MRACPGITPILEAPRPQLPTRSLSCSVVSSMVKIIWAVAARGGKAMKRAGRRLDGRAVAQTIVIARRSVSAALGLLLAALLMASLAQAPAALAAPVMSIAVSGDHLVNRNGAPIVLRGVDTSGTEYACVSEHSIFDGTRGGQPDLHRRHALLGLQRRASRVERVLLARCAGRQARLFRSALPGWRSSTMWTNSTRPVCTRSSTCTSPPPGRVKEAKAPAPHARRTLFARLLELRWPTPSRATLR